MVKHDPTGVIKHFFHMISKMRMMVQRRSTDKFRGFTHLWYNETFIGQQLAIIRFTRQQRSQCYAQRDSVQY